MAHAWRAEPYIRFSRFSNRICRLDCRVEGNHMRKATVSFGVSILILAFSVSVMAQGQPSVPAPEGWKTCPRCQNNKDRADAKTTYKVEGHAFSPRDLSGVWGFGGAGGAFRDTPPLTEWGKQQHAATMSEKNAAGEYLHDKDTS